MRGSCASLIPIGQAEVHAPGARRARLALALVALLGACRAPSSGPDTSVLDELETVVRANFFDPARLDADWTAAVARTRGVLAQETAREARTAALNALVGMLGASHTAVFSADDPSWYVLVELFWDALEPGRRAQLCPDGPPPWPGIGILPERVERDGTSAWFARTVLPGGPAAAVGVRVGDRLLAVEGEPYRPVASFRGRAGRPTRLWIQRTRDPASKHELVLVPDERAPSAAFRRALAASAHQHRRGGKRLAYAALVSWAGEELQAELAELLLSGALATADGLVLDLRGGFGGANPGCLGLFQRGLPRLTFRDHAGHVLDLESSWSKPVVLLVDEGTTSGKEVVARAFQRSARGRIVGARTAGAVLGGSVFLLADGSLLYLAVSDVRVDGERLEGLGVTPDVLVPRERPYSAGADPQLERALATLVDELLRHEP